MKEIVIAGQSGKDVTTSLIVAHVFEKYHGKVLRDIESLSCSEEFNRANFGLIEYKDKMGRMQKAYEMTKDGFSFLVMGYTGEKAGQFKEMFIREFNKRESLLKSDDYILQRSQEILNRRVLLLEQQVKEKDLLLENANETITKQAPKVDYYDHVLMSIDTLTTTQIAKSFGICAKTLNKKLQACGLIFYQSGQWHLRSPYDRWGLHKVRTASFTRGDGSQSTKSSTVWTEKGRRLIVALNDCGFIMKQAILLIKGELQKGGAL